MLKTILKVRLSVLAPILLVVSLAVVFLVGRKELTSGQLALFSVNSFLFGYYFNPLLDSQKSRVANLNAATRQEEMTLLDILTQAHLLSAKARHTLKVKLNAYLESIIGNNHISADNEYYDEILFWLKHQKSEDQQIISEIYSDMSKTQDNRSDIANLFATRIYSHEWLVVSVLFSITLYFAIMTDFGGSIFFGLMLAVLCAGLCMLMAIFLKYATLTHKEAKRMWDTLKELETTHFDDVTLEELKAEMTRLKTANAKQTD